MKKFFVSIVSIAYLFTALTLNAQVLNPGQSNLDVKSFACDENDLTAIVPETQKYDCVNGVGKAAVLKIMCIGFSVNDLNYSIPEGVCGSTQKGSEIWLYLGSGTKKIKISTSTLGELEYSFQKPIENGKVYKLIIVSNNVSTKVSSKSENNTTINSGNNTNGKKVEISDDVIDAVLDAFMAEKPSSTSTYNQKGNDTKKNVSTDASGQEIVKGVDGNVCHAQISFINVGLDTMDVRIGDLYYPTMKYENIPPSSITRLQNIKSGNYSIHYKPSNEKEWKTFKLSETESICKIQEGFKHFIKIDFLKMNASFKYRLEFIRPSNPVYMFPDHAQIIFINESLMKLNSIQLGSAFSSNLKSGDMSNWSDLNAPNHQIALWRTDNMGYDTYGNYDPLYGCCINKIFNRVDLIEQYILSGHYYIVGTMLVSLGIRGFVEDITAAEDNSLNIIKIVPCTDCGLRTEEQIKHRYN